MGLLRDYIKREWQQDDRDALQQQVQGLIGQAPSPEYQQMSEQGVPVEQYIQQTPMDVKAGTGAMAGGTLDREALARGLIGVPEMKQIGAQMLQQAQPVQPVQPKQTSVVQNLAAAGYVPGTPPFQQAMKDYLSKAQTQVNINNQKPLGSGAATWQNKGGESPPPTATIQQASDAGYRPVTAEQRKSTLTATQAAAPLGRMIKFGFGEGDKLGLFPADETGLLSRTGTGVSSYFAGKAETDKATSLYNSSQNALVTGLARLVGQVGTLTDRDVDTVKSMFPQAGFTPQGIAKAKFESIATLLMGKGVPKKQLKEMGFPPWSFGEEDSGNTGLIGSDNVVDFGDLQ